MGSNAIKLIPDNKSDFEDLHEYLLSGKDTDNLPEKLKQMWDIVSDVHDVIKNYAGETEQLRVMRELKGIKGMSRAQLLRYRDATKQIIGTQFLPSKNYHQLTFLEKIDKGFEMAEKLDDNKLYASTLREYREFIKSIPEADKDQAPVANVLVIVNDGQPEVLDLTDPSKIPAEHRKAVVAALFNSQTPHSPDEFITAEEV